MLEKNKKKMICGDKGEDEDGEDSCQKGELLRKEATIKNER